MPFHCDAVLDPDADGSRGDSDWSGRRGVAAALRRASAGPPLGMARLHCDSDADAGGWVEGGDWSDGKESGGEEQAPRRGERPPAAVVTN